MKILDFNKTLAFFMCWYGRYIKKAKLSKISVIAKKYDYFEKESWEDDIFTFDLKMRQIDIFVRDSKNFSKLRIINQKSALNESCLGFNLNPHNQLEKKCLIHKK